MFDWENLLEDLIIFFLHLKIEDEQSAWNFFEISSYQRGKQQWQ